MLLLLDIAFGSIGALLAGLFFPAWGLVFGKMAGKFKHLLFNNNEVVFSWLLQCLPI